VCVCVCVTHWLRPSKTPVTLLSHRVFYCTFKIEFSSLPKHSPPRINGDINTFVSNSGNDRTARSFYCRLRCGDVHNINAHRIRPGTKPSAVWETYITNHTTRQTTLADIIINWASTSYNILRVQCGFVGGCAHGL